MSGTPRVTTLLNQAWQPHVGAGNNPKARDQNNRAYVGFNLHAPQQTSE